MASNVMQSGADQLAASKKSDNCDGKRREHLDEGGRSLVESVEDKDCLADGDTCLSSLPSGSSLGQIDKSEKCLEGAKSESLRFDLLQTSEGQPLGERAKSIPTLEDSLMPVKIPEMGPTFGLFDCESLTAPCSSAVSAFTQPLPSLAQDSITRPTQVQTIDFTASNTSDRHQPTVLEHESAALDILGRPRLFERLGDETSSAEFRGEEKKPKRQEIEGWQKLDSAEGLSCANLSESDTMNRVSGRELCKCNKLSVCAEFRPNTNQAFDSVQSPAETPFCIETNMECLGDNMPLSYVPILTSAKGYIETLNSGLLAVDPLGPVLESPLQLMELPTVSSDQLAPDLKAQQATSTECGSQLTAPAGPLVPLIAVSTSGGSVASSVALATVQASPFGTLVTSLPCTPSTSVSITSPVPTMMATSAVEGLTIVASLNGNSSNEQSISNALLPSDKSNHELEPLKRYHESQLLLKECAEQQSTDQCSGELGKKKSIFDGASKDEILEYLEDARERVPEVLFAADEVMVINENEVILVNQLEPNSPATPISIVDADSAASMVVASVPPTASLRVEHQSQGELESPVGGAERRLNREELALRGHLCDSRADLNVGDTERLMTPTSRDQPEPPDAAPSESQFEFAPFGSINSTWTSNDANQVVHDKLATSLGLHDAPDRILANQMGALIRARYNYFQARTASEGEIQESHAYRLSSLCGERTETKPCPESVSGFSEYDPVSRDCQREIGGSQDAGLDTRNSNQEAARTLNCSGDDQSSQSQDYHPRRKSSSELALLQQGSHSSNNGLVSGLSSTSGDRQGEVSRIQESLPAPHDHVLDAHPPVLVPSSSPSSSSSSSSSSSPQSTGSSSSSSGDTSGNCSADSASSLSCSSSFVAAGDAQSATKTIMTKVTATAETGPPCPVPTKVASSRACMTGCAPGSPTRVAACTHPFALSKDPSLLAERDDSGLSADYSPALLLAKNEGPINVVQVGLTTEHGSHGHLSALISRVFNEIDQDHLQQTHHQLVDSRDKGTDKTQERDLKDIDLQRIPLRKPIGSSKSGTRTGQYATMNHKINHHRRHQSASDQMQFATGDDMREKITEFQCLDCDQLIMIEHLKSNSLVAAGDLQTSEDEKRLHRVYGLPLCKSCEKKRSERKEIISEFVETELKYGRDLNIIHDEFYKPMQIAGLLNKDQIKGIFLNLDELIMAHRRFAERLMCSLQEANLRGDIDYDGVTIGKLFVESADMLQNFESYCVRQGSAACLLARLAKEKELLRIFLRVSQMENTLLRRMNLAAFLMVPVQRVTKYPLLLNRLYKVTPYHHKDRESLRDAQLRAELHLEHINQQTKGISATNKIWRRISNLSPANNYYHGVGGGLSVTLGYGGGGGAGGASGFPGAAGNSNTSSGGSGLSVGSGPKKILAEDIGYIKLRKAAMELLKWDRDETQFMHSGKINYAPLNEYLVKQKVRSLRYITAHALLVVLGRPNWKYRPDLVKSSLDNKLITPVLGGTGIREAALLLFREKNGRFISCRDPLFLSQCVLSNDCSQFNSDYSSLSIPSLNSSSSNANQNPSSSQNSHKQISPSGSIGSHQRSLSASSPQSASQHIPLSSGASEPGAVQMCRRSLPGMTGGVSSSFRSEQNNHQRKSLGLLKKEASGNLDSCSFSSLKSLPEESNKIANQSSQTLQIFSREQAFLGLTSGTLVESRKSKSADPNSNCVSSKQITSRPTNSTNSANTPNSKSDSKANYPSLTNLTILDQLMTRVNSYSSHQTSNAAPKLGSNFTSVPARVQAKSVLPDPITGIANPAQQIAKDVKLSPDKTDIVAPSCQPIPVQNTNKSVNPNEFRSKQIDQTENKPIAQQYNHNFFNHAHHYYHHQPYWDFEESFEIHERLSKESMLLRADTPLKTRYWLQLLRYHAKDLGTWRARRNALANIMMMARPSDH